MRKRYLLLILTIVFACNLNATTYTSAQNGNWMNPTTWSPMGIPIPGDNITINHVVTLDTSFAYTSGTISVLGTLTHDSFGRDLWLNGASAQFMSSGIVTLRNILVSAGTFTNSGILNVNVVANYGTFTNNDNMLGVDSLYNDGNFNNNQTLRVMTFHNNSTMNNYGDILGLITVVDSMYNTGTFLNDAGALLKADSCTNTNSFTNNGVLQFNQFTNTGTFTNTNYMSFVDMTNIGTYTNQDSLIGTGSATNTGNLDNQTGAQFNLAVSFLNVDSVNNNATFTANGRFTIGDSFYNFDIINGTASGSIQCADTSYNSGTMSGSFDFCDLTPPATSPFIDINSGTVAPTITFCTITAVDEITNQTISLYPNPTIGIVYFQFNKVISIEVFNMLGEQIMITKENQVDLTNYENGIYLFRVKDIEGNILSQERIIKQ